MKLVVGCVADNSNKYMDQALRLLKSWRWFAGRLADSEFHVCVVDDVPLIYRKQYERYGAHVHIVSRFSDNHPPSNKLRFLEQSFLRDAERVVLLDCDTVIVQEPSELISEADFAAKIADFPTVTPEIFRSLFDALSLPLPKPTERCTVHGEWTIPYFNAGVLSFSRQAMTSLVPEWIRINRYLIEQLDVLQDRSNFCEQASLSLALVVCGTSFETFTNRLNFPAHCLDEPLDSDFGRTDPVIIHYHWLVDEKGLLLASPYPKLNARIEQFNTRLQQDTQYQFDNNIFWNNRYLHNPELGSGIGSRGELISYKQGVLERVVAEHQPITIYDVGCGDMVVGEVLPEHGYTGIDVSNIVIEANSNKFPNRKFLCGDFINMPLDKCDLIVCFDVLIHLPGQDQYRQFVEKCVELAGSSGIIAAYEFPPKSLSEITFFHEPISHTLAVAGAINVREIGAYNQVHIFQFNKSSRVTDLPSVSQLKRPVFLVGAMRSGTTLLADLLGRSPYLAHCSFELKDIWSSVGGVQMASPKTHDYECPECRVVEVSSETRANLTNAFLDRVLKLQNKDPYAVFLNKNPHLCNKLPLVKSFFPDARFIWIYRPLPLVVASIKRLFVDVCKRQSTWHWWPFPSDHVRNRCWNALYSEDSFLDIPSERVFPGGNILYLAEYWLESNRAVFEFFSNISQEDQIIVSALSFLDSPAAELARLQGFLELPFRSEVCNCMELDNHRNDHWKELLSLDELEQLIGFVDDRGDEINAICREELSYYQQMLEQRIRLLAS